MLAMTHGIQRLNQVWQFLNINEKKKEQKPKKQLNEKEENEL